MGTINAGGFSEVIKRNIDSQRFEAPEWVLLLLKKGTFWIFFLLCQ
jgi:hypothetical protein